VLDWLHILAAIAIITSPLWAALIWCALAVWLASHPDY
jgi:hypothetical protein